MRRRNLWCLAFLAAAACQTERVSAPSDLAAPPGVSFAISDGLHGPAGNPDFFFLPPMVPAPAGLGTFNPSLSPTVKVCQWNGSACVGGGYSETFNSVKVQDGQYHQNWKIPKGAANTVYRVSVLVEEVELGFADVKLNKNPGPDYVGAQGGSNLPIKFWINTRCAGEETCSEGFIDPAQGGSVTFGGEGGEIPTGGVTIPPQGDGKPITLAIKPCKDGDLGQAGLLVFGSCITIESSLTGQLSEEALIFICDVLDATSSLPPSQKKRIHLHRRHNGLINALENSFAPLCVEGEASIGGALRALAQGKLKQAGRQLARMVSPRPLYALHLGAGGSSGAFSDFQFAEEPYEETFEDGIPTDWTVTGATGTSAAVTNLGPTQGTSFGYLVTPGVLNPSFGGTGGSTLVSPEFAALGGSLLSIDFNFLTNDGTTDFRDFMFIQLLDQTGGVVATLANGNTTGDTDQAVPALGGPAPVISGGVSLSPLPIPRFFDGIETGPLSGTSFAAVKYGGGNGGSTGWITTSYVIPSTGTYKLRFVVMDFGNRSFPSGLAIDNIAVTAP